jgi:hypothetical protein
MYVLYARSGRRIVSSVEKREEWNEEAGDGATISGVIVQAASLAEEFSCVEQRLLHCGRLHLGHPAWAE